MFFVDSLWQATDAVKDWSAMTNLLQATDKTSVVTLTNAEETVLIEFMLSAVQRATGSLVAILSEKKRVSNGMPDQYTTDSMGNLYTFAQCRN